MNRKPRIFIAIQYLEIGGAERALLGLLNALDYNKVEVDLFLYEHRGELLKQLLSSVNLLQEMREYAALNKPLRQVLLEGQVRMVYGRLRAKWEARRFAGREENEESIAEFQYKANYTTPHLPPLSSLGEYDLAISFLTPHNIVRDKVRAKQKWAWIHTDYSFVTVDVVSEQPVWEGFDKIISISPDVTKGFSKTFPVLSSKVVEMENILLPDLVWQGAGQIEASEILREMPRDGCVRLLSVGRFSYAKNYDNVPDICRRIVEGGLDIRWYIIGFGGEEELIRRKISEAGMEERVILLGKRNNPYPYIQACDVYVQPSRYEGKSVTVREAQILYKPVVIADYATASSQIDHGVDGYIVPQDNEGCARELAAFIKDKVMQETLVNYLRAHDYGNAFEVKKIYTALGIV